MSGDNGESGKRAGLPPHVPPQNRPPISSPYSRILAPGNHLIGSQQMGSRNLRTGNPEMSSLARTLSQPLPSAFDSSYHSGSEQRGESTYSLLQPSPFAPSGSSFGIGASFHEAHRRPITETGPSQPSGSIPLKSPGALDVLVEVANSDPFCAGSSGVHNSTEMMMGEGTIIEMVHIDEDVFSAFMDLDCIDVSTPTSGAARRSGKEIQGSFDPGADGCETDETSSADEIWRSAFKRSAGVSSMPEMGGTEAQMAAVGDASQTNLHMRSASNDSFMQLPNQLSDKFVEIPSNNPPAGTQQPAAGQIFPPGVLIQTSAGMTLGGVAFPAPDLEKIIENNKLSEIALNDPKRVKKILSNRKSAARSKERKMKYVAELEQKIMTLQNETEMMASKLAQLEQASSALTIQNNELRLRLQAFEQQSHLQEALKAALTDELQRLKIENEASSSRSHQSEMRPPEEKPTESKKPDDDGTGASEERGPEQ